MSKGFLFVFFLLYCLTIVFVPSLQAGESNVGGNLKFFLYDKSEGTSNGVSGSQHSIAGFNSLYMLISKEISDTISVFVEPKISAETGATPKLNKAIGSQMKDPNVYGAITPNIGFVRAQIIVKLPKEYELSAGMLRPIFTEDYGAQLWYEEEYHGNSVSGNSYLGSASESGIEIYKNFEIQEICSIPVYLYLVNGSGSQFSDNNESKSLMIHIAPEIDRLKFMGSIFTGKWDNSDKYDFIRYSGGVGFEYRKFMFRSEYITGNWDSKELYNTTDIIDLTKELGDIKPSGYYVKAAYRIFPWVRVLVSYSQYDYNFTNVDKQIGGSVMSKQAKIGETYTQLSPILNFYASPESIIYLQYDITDNKREDNSAKLQYNRLVLGWRTNF